MALQTFTAGQVLSAAQMTNLQADHYNQTVSTKTASYTLVAADVGTRVVMNSASATTITVNTGLFAAGDTLWIHNIGAGACTITAGTATVSTSGSLVLNQNDGGWLYFTSTGVAIYFPQGSGTPGLVHINTTSFSAVSSQSVNSVFSSTYDHYLLMISYDSISGANSNFWFKLRVSGTDSSTTYANWIMGITSGGAANNIVNNSATFSIINQSNSTETLSRTTNLFLFNPNKAQHTYGHLQSSGISQSGLYIGLAGSIAHLTATAYDGFTLGRDSGTFTGAVSTFGYRKS